MVATYSEEASGAERGESLARIVEEIAERLREVEEARDEAQELARRARVLSKTAILLIHGGDLETAEGRLLEARRMMMASEAISRSRWIRVEELSSAQEEHAEAVILLNLMRGEDFPNPEELGVEPGRYLLGLADVIGELRREAVEALRIGDLSRAEEMLRLMEHIYLTLTSAEEASVLLRGLRRKLDVARSLIEGTRGQIAEERGRMRLLEALRKLEDQRKSSSISLEEAS